MMFKEWVCCSTPNAAHPTRNGENICMLFTPEAFLARSSSYRPLLICHVQCVELEIWTGKALSGWSLDVCWNDNADYSIDIDYHCHFTWTFFFKLHYHRLYTLFPNHCYKVTHVDWEIGLFAVIYLKWCIFLPQSSEERQLCYSLHISWF
jgi:hypothetical protein